MLCPSFPPLCDSPHRATPSSASPRKWGHKARMSNAKISDSQSIKMPRSSIERDKCRQSSTAIPPVPPSFAQSAHLPTGVTLGPSEGAAGAGCSSGDGSSHRALPKHPSRDNRRGPSARTRSEYRAPALKEWPLWAFAV